MSDTETLPDDLFLVDVEAQRDEPAGRTLSFSRSTTVLLTFAANRFTRSAARLYQDRFGIGAMDWRMLVMLTRAPGCNAAHASRTIGIDKAAVSRSLARLEKAGLAEAVRNSPDERRRDWWLTAKGRALHAEMLEAALNLQRQILDGFAEDEVEQFNGYLRRALANIEALQEQV